MSALNMQPAVSESTNVKCSNESAKVLSFDAAQARGTRTGFIPREPHSLDFGIWYSAFAAGCPIMVAVTGRNDLLICAEDVADGLCLDYYGLIDSCQGVWRDVLTVDESGRERNMRFIRAQDLENAWYARSQSQLDLPKLTAIRYLKSPITQPGH